MHDRRVRNDQGGDLKRFRRQLRGPYWGMWAYGMKNEFRKRGWVSKMVALLAALHLNDMERVENLMEVLLQFVLCVSE